MIFDVLLPAWVLNSADYLAEKERLEKLNIGYANWQKMSPETIKASSAILTLRKQSKRLSDISKELDDLADFFENEDI